MVDAIYLLKIEDDTVGAIYLLKMLALCYLPVYGKIAGENIGAFF